MTRPAPSRPRRRPSTGTDPRITLDDVEVIACVYGPGTTEADATRMSPLGAGWAREVERWRASDSPYLLLVASSVDGRSRSEPDAVLARDRAAIERAIWASTIHAETRLCLLESFEPTLKPFVRTIIEASSRPAGHA
ncbi:MAG TPA: hypothetical protein VNS57_01975 [Steroidobacteraceae bacterium]|nr:hypothetical protein [Steroidobacteraceae bacterium]